MFVDTHTHIYLPELSAEIDQVIARANANGIRQFFLPNIDSTSIDAVFKLANQFPDQCYPMMGLHPCSVNENYEQELATIFAAARANKIYAIGEIGIDLYWDKTTLANQLEAFETQINWAKDLNLPIVIHCRDAFDEVYAVLLKHRDEKLRGIFHCFTGNLDQAKKIIDLGFYLGIGGVVTYKNAGLDSVVAQIHLDHLVLETDSPYLPPVPFRGKPNESSYLVHIAQKVADLHQISIVELARITTENSTKIFGI